MRTIGLLAASFAVPAAAFAWDSNVDNVKFTGETVLFQGTEWAESTEILGIAKVGISVDTSAKLTVDMNAHSEMSWPTALTHKWEGVTNGGEAKLDATATVNVQLINADTNSTIISLPITGYAWQGIDKFNTLLLPGGENVANIDIFPTDLIMLDWTFDNALSGLLEGVDITVGARLKPDVNVNMSGTKVTTEGIDIATRTGTATLPLPSTHNGKRTQTSAWEGVANGFFNLDTDVFITVEYDSSGDGSPEMTIPLNFTVYTIEMAADTVKFPAVTQAYTHPLPAINVRSTVDFGDVNVDEAKEIEIPVQNLGAIDLEGDVTYEGDSAFQIVGTDSILVNGNATDVIVVEFAPEEGEEFEGTLTFETNDPMMPSVEVPVFGSGVKPLDADGDGDGNGDGDLETRGCGCNTTPASAPFGLFAAGLLGMMARRRRKA